MYIISFTAKKGGTTKTTSSVNFAYWLASKNKRVLFIDADPQANATTALHVTAKDSNSLVTLFNGSEVTPEKTRVHNLDVITATMDLLAQKTEKGSALRLAKGLKVFDRKYDYCVIDCPPGHAEIEFNAYQASDGVIVPIVADTINFNSLLQTLDTVTTFQRSNPALKVLGVILALHEPRYLITKEVTEVIQREMAKRGVPVLGTVRRSVRVIEANTSHQSIFEYSPSSTIANDYNNIFTRVLKEIKK